jgi:hypothetical protein
MKIYCLGEEEEIGQMFLNPTETNHCTVPILEISCVLKMDCVDSVQLPWMNLSYFNSSFDYT